MRRGVVAAAGAYVLWGLFPVYWKTLAHVPALEILGHRIVWSLVAALLLLAVLRRPLPLAQLVRQPRLGASVVASAVLIAVNWLVYVWANNNGHMVEASLGYFITPLVSVVLGLLVLRERLRPGQWLAVAVAACGVAYMVATSAGLLWVSLALAFSFGVYGLLRKTTALPSLEGLTVELTILAPAAIAGLIMLARQSDASFLAGDPATTLLLIGAGAVTASPLLLFAYGAQRVTLATLGIVQYLAPSLQLLLGVLLYQEPFTPERLVGFAFVWSALAVYSIEGIAYSRRRRRDA